MIKQSLDGNWQMKKAGSENWIPAKVPGSVYSNLLAAGLMDDPFYRENETAATKICESDYIFERVFETSADLLRHDKVLLHCEGLDTLCELNINGTPVAKTDNMHRTYEFDVKPVLKAGKNKITILFHSPNKYVVEKQQESPLWCCNEALSHGIAHLRKAHYMFGWDWGPILPDMGIWRSISLCAYDTARIGDCFIHQTHGDAVTLDIMVKTERIGKISLTASAAVIAPDGSKATCNAAISNNDSCQLQIVIKNPQLWWPNGYGDHPLYNVLIKLSYENEMLDERKYEIGLRTIRLAREKDEWGESFAFEINGVRIFSMGADYIPEDNILSRCNKERTEKLIRDCVDSHFNTLRVWGGGCYPSDEFYSLCDRYGLIIWQDFMFACGVYRFEGAFRETVAHEIEDNVKRLRHHASLGLWCGNNEIEWMWDNDSYPDEIKQLKNDYVEQFEKFMPKLMKEFDPSTEYWPSSPSSGGGFKDSNGQKSGDMHFWEVWHGRKPFTDYRLIYPRYMSEFGLQSFPCMETVKTFTLPQDRNIFSSVMESHQKSGTSNEKILYYISQYFLYPHGLDSLLYISQIIQAEGIRYGVEHWRRNRGRCMGAIYWQLNDCWPVASWSSIDCYGRKKALHYAAKRFYAPVLASAYDNETSVELYLTNEKRETVDGTLSWQLSDNGFNVLDSGSKKVKVNPLSSGQYIKLDLKEMLDTTEKQRTCYLAYRFDADGVPSSQGTVLFVRPKHYAFTAPHIEAEIAEIASSFVITLRASSLAKFVELKIDNVDADFSDNYFDITDKNEKKVIVERQSLSAPLTLAQLKSKLQIRSLYDSYEKA